MLTVGDKLPAFKLTAVSSGPEGLGGPGKSSTEITDASDGGKGNVVVFWPTDVTFIGPTEIADIRHLHRSAITSRNATPTAG